MKYNIILLSLILITAFKSQSQNCGDSVFIQNSSFSSRAFFDAAAFIKSGYNVTNMQPLGNVEFKATGPYELTAGKYILLMPGTAVRSQEASYFFAKITNNRMICSNGVRPSKEIDESSILLANASIKIYPNPAKDILNVNLSNINLSKVKITLCSALGNILEQRIVNEKKNTNLIFSMTNYTAGIYVLKIEYDKKTVTQKIIKN